MKPLSLNHVFDLLSTRDIPGSEKELEMLCIRIGDLVELNGENWVRENRLRLLEEWEYIVRQGDIARR